MAAEHQHEAWQVQESAKGGHYCAACGDSVEWHVAGGFKGEGQWVTIPNPQMVEIAVADLAALMEAAQAHLPSLSYVLKAKALTEVLDRARAQIPLDAPEALQVPILKASDPTEGINPPSSETPLMQGPSHTPIRAHVDTPMYGHGEGDIVHDDEARITKPATQMFKADPEIDEALGIDREPKPESRYGSTYMGQGMQGQAIEAVYCKRCYALVADMRGHDQWHEGPSIEDMERQIDEAPCAAKAYASHAECILPKGHEATQPKGKRNHKDRTGYQWSASR